MSRITLVPRSHQQPADRPPGRRGDRHAEQGAILLMVAVSIVALIAFSALVVDYGVLWAARHEAQNAADAGALAGAVSLAFGDPTDQVTATNAALATTLTNKIWADVPDVTPADVTFPACPAGSPQPSGTCIRVNVFRNERAGGDPLPMFFGQIVGLTGQGVRATATAQVLVGSLADCVKPFAIPDKWQENLAPADEFNRYYTTGPKAGQLIPGTVDVYVPPSESDPGTGYRLPDNYGQQITLKAGSPSSAIQPGWYFPVRLSPDDNGGNDYRWNIANCNTTAIGPGTVLDLETGNMVGPTRQGMSNLIALDPDAYWDPNANGGLGAPAGGCMASGTCTRSPRLASVALFSPDIWEQGQTNGNSTVTVTNVLGFWIDRVDSGGNVIGYLTYAPALPGTSTTLNNNSSFLRTIVLVR